MSLNNIKLSERQSNITSSTMLYGDGSNITSLNYDNVTIGTKPNFTNYVKLNTVSTTDKVYNAVYADSGGNLSSINIFENNLIIRNINTSTQVYCTTNANAIYYKFLADVNYSFSFNKNTTCMLFMIGGGGGGCANVGYGGGGGAGAYYKDTAYTFYSNITYRVYVGIGGAADTNGGNTYITSNNTTILIVNGGGTTGANGGCGGGGRFDSTSYQQGEGITTGVTYSRGGYNGGIGIYSSPTYLGGGGGGCGGNGGNAYYANTSNYYAGSGGNGISINFTGTTEYYGGGGAGGSATTSYTIINKYLPNTIGGSVGNVIIGGYHNGILHSNIPPVANTGSGGVALSFNNYDPEGLQTYNETYGSAGIVIIATINNINISNINLGIDVANPTQKLDVNGNVKCISYSTLSDIRLKTDILTLENSLSKILKLRGVEYKMIDNINKKYIGLIAQESESIIPEVVSTSGIEGYKTIGYDNIIAVIIEAIKEQNKIIKNLELEIQTL